jgi:hypothetical protein
MVAAAALAASPFNGAAYYSAARYYPLHIVFVYSALRGWVAVERSPYAVYLSWEAVQVSLFKWLNVLPSRQLRRGAHYHAVSVLEWRGSERCYYDGRTGIWNVVRLPGNGTLRSWCCWFLVSVLTGRRPRDNTRQAWIRLFCLH